jgi:hypothetical protein
MGAPKIYAIVWNVSIVILYVLKDKQAVIIIHMCSIVSKLLEEKE